MEGQNLDSFEFDQEFFDALQEDEVQLTQEQARNYGTESASWQTFLEGKKCRSVYEKRINDFLAYNEEHFEEPDMNKNLISYFQFNRQKVDADGNAVYAPTSLRSWLSVFQAFYLHTNRGDLKSIAPILGAKLDQWEKEYEATKAKTFTKHDLRPLFEAANTSDVLLWKTYAAIALGAAARNFEMDSLQFESSVRKATDDNGDFYVVTFYRAKNTGVKVKTECNIRGELEVAAIDDYFACFSPAQRTGKFFKVLKQQQDGTIRAQNKNVGKNTLPKYGKFIARWLGKEDWQSYTGHCFRRTAATFAADHGLSMPQVKALTGHRTDSAVAQYMDRSSVQLDLASEAVSVCGKRSAESAEMSGEVRRTKPKIQQQSSSSSSSARPLQPTGPSFGLDFSHAVINAPIYLDLNSFTKRSRAGETENKENDTDDK